MENFLSESTVLPAVFKLLHRLFLVRKKAFIFGQFTGRKGFSLLFVFVLTAALFSFSDTAGQTKNMTENVNLEEYIVQNLIYPDFAPKHEINGRVELRLYSRGDGSLLTWALHTTDERLVKAATDVAGGLKTFIYQPTNTLLVVKFGNGEGTFIPQKTDRPIYARNSRTKN